MCNAKLLSWIALVPCFAIVMTQPLDCYILALALIPVVQEAGVPQGVTRRCNVNSCCVLGTCDILKCVFTYIFLTSGITYRLSFRFSCFTHIPYLLCSRQNLLINSSHGRLHSAFPAVRPAWPYSSRYIAARVGT